MSALAVAGLVNLCLLLAGLKLFVGSMTTEHKDAVAFYTLFLTLFAWGTDPWFWSGFFHIGVLGYVLPYPSTFAAALTLIALGLHGRSNGKNRYIWQFGLVILAAIVLLTHPTTFLSLVVGLGAQSYCQKNVGWTSLISLGLVLALAFFLAALWPYFPFLQLFTDAGSSGRDTVSLLLYQDVIRQIWPSLLIIPLLCTFRKADWFRPVMVMLLILCLMYAVSGFLGKYAYGRVIAFIVLLLHLLLAERLARWEGKLAAIVPAGSWLPHALWVVVLVCTIGLAWQPILSVAYIAIKAPQPFYVPCTCLAQRTQQYDVVLSDLESSWLVPAYGGKVIASKHPMSFIADHEERKADLDHFFHTGTPSRERQRIITKYQADYLLVQKEQDLPWQAYLSLGRVVMQNATFALVDLHHQSKRRKDSVP